MRILPVVFTWTTVEVVDEDGVASRRRAMVPINKAYDKIATRQFHDGEEYPLVPLEARSRASHSHYFAALHDGFSNLPEDLSIIPERLTLKTPIPPDGWVDAEHLRKWALCETGWCDVAEWNYETHERAVAFAKWYRAKDLYASITVRGAHVTIKTAVSQSAQAMSKEPFENSKRDVLDLVEAMTGLKKGTLNKEAGRAA